MLSDDDIEEEELEDLREILKKGIFKSPSIAELEKKIKSMHKDIISHWIDREISRLDKMIERANEKGWRAELFECIDKRELLRTPKERTRLLEEIPSVIADTEGAMDVLVEKVAEEAEGTITASLEKVAEEPEGTITALVEKVAEEAEAIISASMEKIAAEDAEGVRAAVLEAPLQEVQGTSQHKLNNNRTSINGISDEQHGLLNANRITRMGSESSGKLLDAQGTSINKCGTKSESDEQQRLINANGIKIVYTKQHKPKSNGTSINSKSDGQCCLLDANGITGNISSIESESDEQQKLLNACGIKRNGSSFRSEFHNQHASPDVNGINNILSMKSELDSGHLMNKKSSKDDIIVLDDEEDEDVDDAGPTSSLRESPHPKIQTICLDDDDDDERSDAATLVSRTEKADPAIWHYVDQYNEVQGPFTKIQLRRWQRHFKSDFKVWRSYQSPDEAIFLYDVLGSVTPS